MMRSILKKAFMALTGIALIGFLLAHLAGNLQLFHSSVGFNAYADSLEHLGPILYTAEAILLVIFVAHIILATKVTAENNVARPVQYQMKRTAGESTLASRTMMITGVIILVFVILHIITFKFGDKTDPRTHATVLWELVVKTFTNPLYAAWYVLAMLVLGLHLSHGTSSLFQSLGTLKPDWRTKSRRVGAVVGWLIALGFASMPIWVFITHPKPDAPATNAQIILNNTKSGTSGAHTADVDVLHDR